MSKKRTKVCGIDVHKKFVVATILDDEGSHETLRFNQKVDDLIKLRNWIVDSKCESVAFESTAEYWRPLHDLISPLVPITVANAYHISRVPGKKTDILDSLWIAELELKAMISPSRIVVGEQYDLRSYTRARTSIVHSRTVLKNKVHHLLDRSSILLSVAMKDIFGRGGMIILRGIIERKSIEEIVQSLPKRTKVREKELSAAIPSSIPDGTLHLLKSMLNIIDQMNAEINEIEEQIKFLLNKKRREVRILMTVPGIGFIGASTILAEVGNIHDFPHSDKLAKWVGITPSVYQSANTNLSGPITKQGSKHLRWICIECAHAAVRTPGKLQSYFLRILPRKGYKKAIVAVARKMIRIVWHLLINDEEFHDESAKPKNVVVPKLPTEATTMGVQEIIDLIARGTELIVLNGDQEVGRVQIGS